MIEPSRYSTIAMISSSLSDTGISCGLPTKSNANCCNSSIVKIGKLLSLKRSIKSVRAGLIAIPYSVTRTSTEEPGVITVATLSRIIGKRPRINGQVITVHLAPAAVSE